MTVNDWLWQVEYTAFRDTRDGKFVSADVVDGSDYYKDERIPENFVSDDLPFESFPLPEILTPYMSANFT